LEKVVVDQKGEKNIRANIKRVVVIKAFDNVYGGFGDQPKFPQPDLISFILEEYAMSKDQVFT
jgi:uncharacterized protein YyaL (SSP411 family)